MAVEALVRFNPRARRITLKVDHTRRRAILTAPARRHLRRAERLLRENAGWLSRNLAALPKAAPFADGAVVPVRGAAHTIRHEAGLGRGCVRDGIVAVRGDPSALPARVEALLREAARDDLTQASLRHADALGVAFARMRIGDPMRRWGSCSTSGTISYSWRLVLAPPPVLDYVAAHEVAHMREMNHGPRFWAHVEALCPRWQDESAWLKANGPTLHAVGRAA